MPDRATRGRHRPPSFEPRNHVSLPSLNAIVDADAAARAGWRAFDLARAFLAGGVRWLQVRAKTASSAAFFDLCQKIVEEARSLEALVIVNDRADIARLAAASGVHIGQEDLTPAAVRLLVGPAAIVGLSTHTRGQLDAAQAEPVDYLAVGPVFATSTKPTGFDAVGLDLVRHAATLGRPVVAIGGITLANAASVIEAGASSVAVISDLLSASDPEGRARDFIRLLGDR